MITRLRKPHANITGKLVASLRDPAVPSKSSLVLAVQCHLVWSAAEELNRELDYVGPEGGKRSLPNAAAAAQ